MVLVESLLPKDTVLRTYLAVPHSALDLAAVCDRGISRLIMLTYLFKEI